jgi:hypothetical protein
LVGGEPNKIEAVKLNGTALTITDKAVDIEVGPFAAKDKKKIAETDIDDAFAATLADKLVKSDITIGVTNGTIKVDGNEVAVAGLGSAAFTNSEAYDAKDTAKTLIESLDVKDEAVAGQFVTAVSQADGKITVSRAALPAQTDYSVTVTESSPEGYAKAYTITQNATGLNTTINIPKDMVVESGSVVTNPEGQAEGTYIKLVLANADEDELFINVGDLIEYVTSGSTATDMVQIAIDANHVVTASITEKSITLAKLAEEVTTEIAKAHTHSNKNLLDTYTQTEENLADAVTKKHEHANADELNKIAAGDKQKWDNNAAAVAELAKIKNIGTNLELAADGTLNNTYAHPTTTAADAAFVKVGKDVNGHVVIGDAIAKADLDSLIGDASETANGLMSATDYNRLKDVEAGAEVNIIESITSETLTVGTVDANKAISIDLAWGEF